MFPETYISMGVDSHKVIPWPFDASHFFKTISLVFEMLVLVVYFQYHEDGDCCDRC